MALVYEYHAPCRSALLFSARENVVDTTGAGDVFHAAFVRALFEDWGLKTCLDFSNAVAALKCRGLGGRAELPSFDEALTYMSEGERFNL